MRTLTVCAPKLLLNVLGQACCHAPTDAEKSRDPGYLGCAAAPGAPCSWAARYDGVTDPAYHSERIEAAIPREPHSGQMNDEAFEALVLASGLV